MWQQVANRKPHHLQMLWSLVSCTRGDSPTWPQVKYQNQEANVDLSLPSNPQIFFQVSPVVLKKFSMMKWSSSESQAAFGFQVCGSCFGPECFLCLFLIFMTLMILKITGWWFLKGIPRFGFVWHFFVVKFRLWSSAGISQMLSSPGILSGCTRFRFDPLLVMFTLITWWWFSQSSPL